MKRIIKTFYNFINESDRQSIMELDRSTYDSAADIAGEKGFNKLSDRFREHGREFGSGQERDNIIMVVKHAGEERPINLRLISLKKESNLSTTFTLETEDLDTGIKRDFIIDKYSNKLEFYLMGNHPSLPATRKDARKVLRFFEDNGVDVSPIDPRSISYDDTGL
jgi:hypothetical protein